MYTRINCTDWVMYYNNSVSRRNKLDDGIHHNVDVFAKIILKG